MTFSALDSAITGPLFAAPAMAEVFSDRSRIAAMLRMEAALARAQGQGDLARAVEAIRPEDLDLAGLGRDTAVAGVPVIPFVKAVQARLPANLERAFHKGATTQDVADTALVLQMRDALALIRSDLLAILSGLDTLARTHRETPCVGRTYGQHAAPVTFGFKAAVWLTGIAEVAAGLPALEERVLVASLGGPVGTLASLGTRGPEVAEAFARELGLDVAPIAWHATRARMVEAGAWLATLMGALAKTAADVAHLVSTEVGEAAEPYVPGRGGSSAMPHKRNPVSCTVILAAHAAAKGPVATLLDAMAAAHERPAGLWHAEWHALPTLFGLASGALREARALAEGLEVHPERMRANLDATRGLLFADAAAGRLVTGLGREAAHRLVEEAANAVRTSGRSLPEVLRGMTDLAVDEAFDLAPSVAAAALWTDRALDAARGTRARLQDSSRTR
ncbi:MAG TPA: adenylosuccinate lyase family protein [Microvirga sp.]|jgi:3-carboxy-cis,cis-muconate cycloisomerase|nr:adenylosuccinate lyase family protein [Microvirga sp.]